MAALQTLKTGEVFRENDLASAHACSDLQMLLSELRATDVILY